MSESQKTITRRDFIRKATYATLAVAMGLSPQEEKKLELAKKTKVVLVRDPEAVDKKGRINPKVIQQMLDRSVTSLFDKKDPVESWNFW